MHEDRSRRPDPARSGVRRRLAWVCCLAAVLFPAIATLKAEDSGLDIRRARTTLVDGVWHLSARIKYRLSRNALDALQNGIPLTFELQGEVTRERLWLPDDVIARVHQNFELSWQPLSLSYVVRNRNSGVQRSYTTLYAALSELGRLADIPLVEATRLDAGTSYRVGLRAVLDQQQLPGPLRLLAFWDGGFTLESDWYRWRLDG